MKLMYTLPERDEAAFVAASDKSERRMYCLPYDIEGTEFVKGYMMFTDRYLYKILDGALEAVMFTATAATRFLNVPLKELRLKDGLLVAAIVRNNATIIPDGNTKILDGDKVIVMAKSLFLQDLNDILQ